MRPIWLVIKHEIFITFRKKSFWILSFIMPAILLAFNSYALISDNDLNAGGDDTNQSQEETGPVLPAVGLVDQAGLISEIPPDFPPNVFSLLPDEPSARASLESGEIDQYVLIPADYIKSGEVVIYDENFQIRQDGENMGVAFGSSYQGLLPALINVNLTGDEQLATALANPVPGPPLADYHVVNPQEEAQNTQALAIVVASATPYIYYFILIVSSGYMLQSVTAEKENRTVEVLLLSLRPGQLMLGKILGLTAVVLVQTLIWVGGGRLALGSGASFLNLGDFTFPPGFIIWALMFLISGYLLYAAAMAAGGAIANSAREGAQMTWLMIIPLMPTLMFGSEFLENPHGTLALVLSLFPFSAPSAMVTRIAVANVPFWQILVSLAGVVLTAYFMLRIAGRFFRPHNLLSSTAFSLRRLATDWRE